MESDAAAENACQAFHKKILQLFSIEEVANGCCLIAMRNVACHQRQFNDGNLTMAI